MRPVPPELPRIVEELDRIDAGFVQGNESTHYISIEKSAGGVLAVKANVEGLIHLGKQILAVAAKGFTGAHFHLDEAGMADRCDQPIAFVLGPAEWDK